MSLDHAIENATSGQLALHLDDEKFGEILKACDVYTDTLNSLLRDAQDLSWHPLGFSEQDLDSGRGLADRFQHKAGGADQSAASTFQSHIDRVQELKSLFQALRSAYQTSDRSIANNMNVYGS